jgi:hypothetical protein
LFCINRIKNFVNGDSLKIRGDIREWMLISGVNDTGEKREKFWDKIFKTILLRA